MNSSLKIYLYFRKKYKFSFSYADNSVQDNSKHSYILDLIIGQNPKKLRNGKGIIWMKIKKF